MLFKSNSNIILCGFMAAGKSSVGRLAAKKLNLSFIDTDELIEAEYNMSIPEIFSSFGEQHFRDLEHKLIKSLSLSTDSVIATGGGLPTFKRNLKILQSLGPIIHIERDLKLIYDTVANDASRPLAFQQPFPKLLELYKQRQKIYSACAYTAIKNNSTISECVDEITDIYRDIFKL